MKVIAGFISAYLSFLAPVTEPALFTDDAPLEVVVFADMDAFLHDRSDSASYHEAKILVREGKMSATLPAEIRARGNVRRRQEFCSIPPIKLKIKSKAPASPWFVPGHKYKLVTHCSSETALLKEYLVYRTLNILTDTSLQVRLVRITYHDTQNNHPDIQTWAFFVEDEDDFADRMGAKLVEDRVSPETLVPGCLTRLYAFEYMIGNLDWDIPSGKNIITLAFPNGARVAVPYDFDWSKSVDAPWTGLAPEFDRRNLPPLCRSEAEWSHTFMQFETHKTQIRQLYNQFHYLPVEELVPSLSYYEHFFIMIQKDRWKGTVFQTECG